jgi:hypothetical protein
MKQNKERQKQESQYKKGNAEVKHLHSTAKETRKQETSFHIKPTLYQCL